MAEVVNLRRVRKRRVRVAATKDSAAKRAKSGRARAEREATECARALDEKRLDAHLREPAGDRAE
jgi:hypothetical protein